jgi:hypothetical protein
MKQLLSLAVAVALTTGVVAQSPSQSSRSPTIAGKWNLTFDNQPTVRFLLELKLDRQAVTGTLKSPGREQSLAGEILKNELKFTIPFSGDSGPSESTYTAVLQPDGTLTGTVDTPDGGILHRIEWKAVRAANEP